MTEPNLSNAEPTPPMLALRLLSTLTVFLALGDLVWFIGTFPSYFRWFSQGWMSPGIPLFLLWTFVGLPSLVCGIITLRLAKAVGRSARATTIAFFLILTICTLVPLLASFAAWTAGTARFPWLVWLITLILAIALWTFTLHMGSKPSSKPQPH
jgi:hypothetical protein